MVTLVMTSSRHWAGWLAVVSMAAWLATPAPAQTRGEFTDDVCTALLCHLNETEGTTAHDAAGIRKACDGKFVGNPTWVQGKFGNAIRFNGQSDALDFGPIKSVFRQDGHTTLGEGTVEFWFSPAADISGSARQGDIVDCNVSPRVGFNAKGQLQAGWMAEQWAANNYKQLATPNVVWKADTWYNVKFCWDPTGHYLFVNDALVASDKLSTGVMLGSLNVSLGAYWNGKSWIEMFAGRLEEVRISTVNRCLEMTSKFADAGGAKEKPPIGPLKAGELGPYAFDFGPGYSDPTGGFVRVSSATSYAPERGFGWTAGLYRHRTAQRTDWTSCPLTQTVIGWLGTPDDFAPAKFRVDCPAGKYRVFAVGGMDPWTQADVLVAGEKKVTLRTFKVPFLIRTAMFEVEVKAPGLELEIQSPLCRWSLCALVIYPAASSDRVEPKLALIQHEIEAGSAEFRAALKVEPTLVEPEDENALPEPDAESVKRGFLLAAVPIQDLAPPTFKPSQAQLVMGPITMEVARDENQTQRIRLWALKRMADIRLDPGQTLRSTAGDALPADAVEMRRVDYEWRKRLLIRKDGSVDFYPREYWRYPTKLERQGSLPWGADGSGALNMVPVNVEADHARDFAVMVRAPKDAKPGDYAGTLRLQANGQTSEIALRVRVLPILLTDEGLPQYRFYGYIDAAIDSDSPPVQAAAIDYMRKELRFMKAWGANQWPTGYSYYVRRESPEKSLDPRFVHFMNICQEEGMVGGKYFYMWWTTWNSYFGVPWHEKPEEYSDLDTSPKYQAAREKVTAEVAMMLREFKARGWPEPLFGPFDEPQLKHGPIMQALHNVIHTVGGKLSTQTPSNSIDLKWLEADDIPLSYNNWFFYSRCQELHRRGIPNQFWRGIWGHERTGNLARAESGLLGLYCGVDALQYAFWYVPHLNPETDLDNVGWPVEMTAGFLRDFGPVSSVNVEVIRTARDDARYALAVRRAIAAAKNDPARRAVAERIEAALNKMLAGLPKDNDTPMDMGRANAQDWDALRVQLKNWALELGGFPVPAQDQSPASRRFTKGTPKEPKASAAPAGAAGAGLLNAAKSGWTLQFADTFDNLDRDGLGPDWRILSGKWGILNGAIVSSGKDEAQVVCTRKFPGSVRLEYDAMSRHPGDLSALIGIDESGYASGYFFGFGSEGNVTGKLLVAGGLERSYDGTVTPGKVHHVICQREGQTLTHIVDGKVLMSQKDKTPLRGDAHQQIGFYVWGEGQISNVSVYTKPE